MVCCRKKNIISHCLSTKTSTSNWVKNRKTPQAQRPGQHSNVPKMDSQYSRNLLVYSLFATRICLFHVIIAPSTCTFCSFPTFLDFIVYLLIFWSPWLCPSLSSSLFSHKTTAVILTYKPWKTAPESPRETTQLNKHMKRCSASLVPSKVQILSRGGITSHPSGWQSLDSDDVAVWKPVEQPELPDAAGRSADWHSCSASTWQDARGEEAHSLWPSTSPSGWRPQRNFKHTRRGTSSKLFLTLTGTHENL